MTAEPSTRKTENGRGGVSVIIPSFGRLEQLSRCLESIRHSDPQPAGGIQVIVVTSTYTSEETTVIADSGATVVRMDGTVWVSEARNAGAASADGDHLLFLDDDNVVAPNAIWLLRQVFDRWPDTVVTGPVMYYGSAPDRIWCAGVKRSKVFMRTHLVTRLPSEVPDRIPSEDFPNCFMVRRAAFTAVSGFDADLFPQHMEETDLARRLVASTGGDVWCIPAAKVWHFIGTSFARRLHMHDARRAFWIARGRTIFTAVYGTRLQWFAYALVGQWVLAAVYLAATIAQAPDRAGVIHAYARGMSVGFRVGAANRREAKPHRAVQVD